MILQTFWNARCRPYESYNWCGLCVACWNSQCVTVEVCAVNGFSRKNVPFKMSYEQSRTSHTHTHTHQRCSSFQSFVIVRSAAFYLSHVSRCIGRSSYGLVNCHPGKKAAHMINEKRQLCWLWAPKRPTAIFDIKMNRRAIYSGWQFGVIFRSVKDTERKRIQNSKLSW